MRWPGIGCARKGVRRTGLGHRDFSTPPPHIVCGCGSVYSGGEPSAGCAVVSTIAYHWQSAANGTPMQPTLSPCWLPPWPPGSQSTGAPSSRAAPSAPGSQPIYCEWMGLSGCGEFCCFLFFLEALGGFFCFLLFWRHFLGDNFLGGRLPSFCHQKWFYAPYCIVEMFFQLI